MGIYQCWSGYCAKVVLTDEACTVKSNECCVFGRAGSTAVCVREFDSIVEFYGMIDGLIIVRGCSGHDGEWGETLVSWRSFY